MRRQIDGAPATALRTRVVPLGSRRENLELAACHMRVPSASGRLLDGLKRRILLAVDRKQRLGIVAWHLAKMRQRRSIK